MNIMQSYDDALVSFKRGLINQGLPIIFELQMFDYCHKFSFVKIMNPLLIWLYRYEPDFVYVLEWGLEKRFMRSNPFTKLKMQDIESLSVCLLPLTYKDIENYYRKNIEDYFSLWDKYARHSVVKVSRFLSLQNTEWDRFDIALGTNRVRELRAVKGEYQCIFAENDDHVRSISYQLEKNGLLIKKGFVEEATETFEWGVDF